MNTGSDLTGQMWSEFTKDKKREYVIMRRVIRDGSITAAADSIPERASEITRRTRDGKASRIRHQHHHRCMHPQWSMKIDKLMVGAERCIGKSDA